MFKAKVLQFNAMSHLVVLYNCRHNIHNTRYVASDADNRNQMVVGLKIDVGLKVGAHVE